jgi:hypothetical protein
MLEAVIVFMCIMILAVRIAFIHFARLGGDPSPRRGGRWGCRQLRYAVFLSHWHCTGKVGFHQCSGRSSP